MKCICSMLMIRHVAKDAREKAVLQPSWTLVEGPRDPESYVDKASKLWELSRLGWGFPSFWSTAEREIGNAASELRRRGTRVYLPEPELDFDNPAALIAPRAAAQVAETREAVQLFCYADDVVIVGPAEQVEVFRAVCELSGNSHANPPEPQGNDADRTAPRPRVRVMDYDEVRAETIKQEACPGRLCSTYMEVSES